MNGSAPWRLSPNCPAHPHPHHLGPAGGGCARIPRGHRSGRGSSNRLRFTSLSRGAISCFSLDILQTANARSPRRNLAPAPAAGTSPGLPAKAPARPSAQGGVDQPNPANQLSSWLASHEPGLEISRALRSVLQPFCKAGSEGGVRGFCSLLFAAPVTVLGRDLVTLGGRARLPFLPRNAAAGSGILQRGCRSLISNDSIIKSMIIN